MEAVLAAYMLGGPAAAVPYGVHLPDDAELAQLIHDAVGEASMCWTYIRGAGVFDSRKAVDVATRLKVAILHRMIEAQLAAQLPPAAPAL